MENVKGVILLVLLTCARFTPDNQYQRTDCFHLQMKNLTGRVTSTTYRLKSLTTVQTAVEHAFNSEWPGSKVKLFGSLFTGLGSSSSDVDFYVSLPSGYNNEVIRKACDVFRASPDTYRNVHVRSRLPAITFYYAPADLNCDLNFKDEGTYESGLLQYLLSLDDRALKLAILVKHWAKLHKLVNPKYLTSYGMMMLVVFYLQLISILPSVIELQKNCPPNVLNDTNHFNVAFERKVTVSKNNQSLYEILGGFFAYYENFDFDNYIVCPFTGRPVWKSLFRNLDTVPDEFHLYKSNVANNISNPLNITAVSIQSLLILNDNCAWRVDSAAKFTANFKYAARMFRETHRCNVLKALGIGVMSVA